MKLSIITVNLNNAAGLRKTIESVVNQSYTDFEYIIIDGSSTDGGVEVIKEYADKITYWVSEPDKGIYNAMNKGILQSKGEYLQFLNSGDWLISNSILDIVNSNLTGEEIIYGDGILSFKDGRSSTYIVPEKLTLDYFYSGSLFHPSAFIKKDLFITYGLYNESNKIVSDWEFFLKTIMVNNVFTKHFPLIIANAEDGGISRDSKSINIIKEEVNLAFGRYFPTNVTNLMKDYEKTKAELKWIKSRPLIKFFFALRNIKHNYFDENRQDVLTEVYKSN